MPDKLFATLGYNQNGKNLSIAGKELRICPSDVLYLAKYLDRYE